jgi:hypothetical protein
MIQDPLLERSATLEQMFSRPLSARSEPTLPAWTAVQRRGEPKPA